VAFEDAFDAVLSIVACRDRLDEAIEVMAARPQWAPIVSRLGAIRSLPARARRAQLDGYLARIVEHDFADQGHQVRRPVTLRAWLAAYEAATATTTTYNAILNAATASESNKPAKTTTTAVAAELDIAHAALSLCGGRLPVLRVGARPG
jgi:hypothetical protein